MTRPPVCGAGATFGLLMEENERLRRIELEEGDGDAVSDERDLDRETLLLSESGVSIRDEALRRLTAPTRFRKATVSVCSPASASLNGVPRHRSTAFTSAPRATRYLTAARWPSAAPRCNAVLLSCVEINQ